MKNHHHNINKKTPPQKDCHC